MQTCRQIKKKVSERIAYPVTERQADRDIGRKCKKENEMSETHTHTHKETNTKEREIMAFSETERE